MKRLGRSSQTPVITQGNLGLTSLRSYTLVTKTGTHLLGRWANSCDL